MLQSKVLLCFISIIIDTENCNNCLKKCENYFSIILFIFICVLKFWSGTVIITMEILIKVLCLWIKIVKIRQVPIYLAQIDISNKHLLPQSLILDFYILIIHPSSRYISSQ